MASLGWKGLNNESPVKVFVTVTKRTANYITNPVYSTQNHGAKLNAVYLRHLLRRH
jgi:hypothetical protein